ncbi:MAG TPA: FecR domain-containing protein [Candidatus Acidoferrales bacterium]|nr:FecR domain-containing protein [Candidatus Acidoferrales bacterium]
MPIQRPPLAPRPKTSHVEIYWKTVTYRTVAIYVILIFAVVMAILYLIFPEAYSGAIARISQALGAGAPSTAQLTAKQAKFVNLDGRVQIKKVNSVQWVAADYRMALDKGDLIQTSGDGVARITFADGTTYTVQSDTLVTVEENSVGRDSETRVAMHISSGAVDLATGTWDSPKSKAEVSFSNAVASVQQNSRAAVRSDPSTSEGEITVSAGAAELSTTDGRQHVEIGRWERVTVPSSGGPVVKSNVLAPPDLTQPLNLQPLIVPDPKKAPVRFEWKPVQDAVSYELRISTTSMFSRIVEDRKLTGTSVEITGFDQGDYFWDVLATDQQKRVSAPSDTFKFTLATQGKGQEMLLEVGSTELHGNVVEITGRTEPGAALIINGEQVADIRSDGTFKYFTAPLTRGSQTIVLTGQNRRGGTAIKRVEIVIP